MYESASVPAVRNPQSVIGGGNTGQSARAKSQETSHIASEQTSLKT